MEAWLPVERRSNVELLVLKPSTPKFRGWAMSTWDNAGLAYRIIVGPAASLQPLEDASTRPPQQETDVIKQLSFHDDIVRDLCNHL